MKNGIDVDVVIDVCREYVRELLKKDIEKLYQSNALRSLFCPMFKKGKQEKNWKLQKLKVAKCCVCVVCWNLCRNFVDDISICNDDAESTSKDKICSFSWQIPKYLSLPIELYCFCTTLLPVLVSSALLDLGSQPPDSGSLVSNEWW